MRIRRLFKWTRFGIFAVFGLIVLSTSILCIYTVDTEMVEDIDMSGGTVSAPTRPGLGFDIDWDLVKSQHVATLE